MSAKKSKHKRSKREPSELHVYVDDSGNSGLNLFDDKQPFYWTAALLSPVDLQMVGLEDHRRWTSRLNVSELHGSALGLGRMEEIAVDLRDFFERRGCRFAFSTVEKRYHAGTMLAQLVLDSDYNRAVASLHDHVPYFRRALTLAILSVFHSSPDNSRLDA